MLFIILKKKIIFHLLILKYIKIIIYCYKHFHVFHFEAHYENDTTHKNAQVQHIKLNS